MFATVCVLLVSPALAGSPSEELQARLTGVFQIAESVAELEPRLDAAVDKAIASLFLPFRPLAKIKLRPEVEPCATYTVKLTAEVFASHCEGEKDDPISLGQPRTIYDDGDAYQVTTVVGTRSVKVSVMGEDGGRNTTWIAGEEGRLQVSSAIVSPHLAEPLAWTISYRKTP